MKRFVLSTLLLGLAVVFSCKSVSSSSKKEGVAMSKIEDVAYEVLSGDFDSAFAQQTKQVYVARSLTEVIAVSEGDESVISLCEKVDFNKEAVIFAFGGRFNTGGYSVIVKSVKREKGGKVQVIFAISSPDSSEVVTQAITSPSLIVAIGAKKGEVVEASFEN